MPRPPNVLILWTDEQRHDTLPVAGAPWCPAMPELARLTATSTAFTRAYCTQPVCTPARGSVMTGLMPHAHGAYTNNVPLDADARCLPEVLPAGAFRSGYIGKWHLGDEIFPQHGFEDWIGVDDHYLRYYSEARDRDIRCQYHHWLCDRGYRPDDTRAGIYSRGFHASLPDQESKPCWQADRAIEFIEERAAQPWVLSVNTLEPHMPFFSSVDGTYEPDGIPLPRNHLVDPGDSCFMRSRITNARYRTLGFERFDLSHEAGWRRVRANYFGLCSQVDHHFGRILRALEASGQFDDTLIVFTSDHGDMMGSHRMLAKGVMYEESTRIPLLVKLPGQREARVCDDPVSQIDILPTIVDALGMGEAGHCHGRSLLPSCRGDGQQPEDLLIQWCNNQDQDVHAFDDQGVVAEWAAHLGDPQTIRAGWEADVRTLITPDGWRYSVNTAGERELFHLAEDPGETSNLAPGGAAKMAQLHPRLLARMAACEDNLTLPSA